MRGLRAALLIANFALVPQSAAQQASAMAHGQSLSAATVGPEAAGYRGLKPFAGGPVTNGAVPAFARTIAETARYDGFTVRGPHLLIEGAAFSTALDISTSKPVVLRGVSVRPLTHSSFAVLSRPGAGPVLILWSELGGGDARAIDAAVSLRADHALVFRSRLSGAGDGISVSGSDVRILENIIETRTASPGDHNDAIQLLGAPKDIEIARNKILNRNPQTSCVTILGSDIRVRNNYLSGGGWTLYGGAMNNGKGGASASNVIVTGNVFGRDYAPKSGHFGPVTYWDKSNAWSYNAFSDGTPVEP